MASRELIDNRQRQEGRRLPANATTNAAARSAVPTERRTARSRRAGPLKARARRGERRTRRRATAPLDREVLHGYSATRDLGGCSRSIDVAAVGDVYYRHHASLVIDSVDEPVGTTTRAKPVVHRREQPLPDPVRVQQQRARDELAGSRRNSFRETLAQCAADGRGGPEFVGFFRGLPAHRAWRCLMASASSPAETNSPRASSASDSASRFVVAASRIISRFPPAAPGPPGRSASAIQR
jgi:hypothetical protein